MNGKKKTLFYPNFIWEQNYHRILGSVLHRFGIKSEQIFTLTATGILTFSPSGTQTPL